MSKCWYIPLIYIVYVLSLVSQNIAFSIKDKPLISYGYILEPWFIASVIATTLLLDILYDLYLHYLQGV